MAPSSPESFSFFMLFWNISFSLFVYLFLVGSSSSCIPHSNTVCHASLSVLFSHTLLFMFHPIRQQVFHIPKWNKKKCFKNIQIWTFVVVFKLNIRGRWLGWCWRISFWWNLRMDAATFRIFYFACFSRIKFFWKSSVLHDERWNFILPASHMMHHLTLAILFRIAKMCSRCLRVEVKRLWMRFN
jgi:hypothetical protein